MLTSESAAREILSNLRCCKGDCPHPVVRKDCACPEAISPEQYCIYCLEDNFSKGGVCLRCKCEISYMVKVSNGVYKRLEKGDEKLLNELDRANDEEDQMREDLAYEKRRVRAAEGITYSLRGNMDFVQSLIASVQSVFSRIAEEDDALCIQMKSKRKSQTLNEMMKDKRVKGF